MKIDKKEDYLLVTISDVVISFQRAEEILDLIGEECVKSNCNKVLLDERSVESRELTEPDIMKLSNDMIKEGLNKIYMAFWCQAHLRNKYSGLLRLFTFENKYMVQHFTDSKPAIAWLRNQKHN
jgi:hypothetical protein